MDSDLANFLKQRHFRMDLSSSQNFNIIMSLGCQEYYTSEVKGSVKRYNSYFVLFRTIIPCNSIFFSRNLY